MSEVNNNDFEKSAEKFLEEKEASNNIQEENTTKPTSLGKASNFQGKDDAPKVKFGYIEIYPRDFPSRSIFYNDDIRFFIRAAEVREIKHFSMLDERDPLYAFAIDDALNEIISNCVDITFNKTAVSYKDIREEDRFHIVMKIRELTFPQGENKLLIPHKCGECEHENKIDLALNIFEQNDLDEGLVKYYDDDKKLFNVKTKSSGDITLVAPSIGVMREVTKYIKSKQSKGDKIDSSFIKVLPYMVQDWRNFNERTIDKLHIEFLNWDKTKYQVFSKLVEMLKIGYKETLHTSCEKCGAEVFVPLQFPGGIKNLFVVSDISGELL